MKKLLFIIVLGLLFSSFINAQGKMGVGVQAGIALPMGDFGDGYDMGFGGNATFAYHLNPMVDITGSIGYLTWSGKDGDYTFSSIPVLVGIRYYFGQGKFHPYVTGELGMHFTTVDVPSVVIYGITVGGGSASDSFFGFGAGAGFLYQLSPTLDLDVNAKFSNISSSGGSSSYITILAGVLVAI
jgi:opacity protein-like surface antigen